MMLGDPAQIPAVHRIQAARIHFQPGQGGIGGFARHRNCIFVESG
jgi:hypothetical protein